MNDNEQNVNNVNDGNTQEAPKPEKKSFLEQLKGLGFWGYLGLACVVKAGVEIVKSFTRKN